MSDQKKGLRNAVKELAPFAEDRNCARHIYSYRAALEDLKTKNQQANRDFLEREPQRFYKAFISTSSKCDSIDNNMSETFNHYIVKAKSKHVIGKEMALANKGVGVLVCKGTGNICCRMPTEKRAHFVNPPRRSNRQAGTRNGANSGSSSTAVQMPTQESQT
ncbi:hypothetical protein C2S52_006278 [Perilla frutescens var. hirtella]|nr:hypothetical protein C2S52_006278 [Perilla frutescens var. hirtella]